MITYRDGIEEKFSLFHHTNTHVITDFDETMTAGKYNSWSVFMEVLGQGYSERAMRLLDIFYPKMNQDMEPERKMKIMERWWQNHLKLFQKVPLRRDHLNEKLIEPLELRKGIHETFTSLRRYGVPITVFSAGVGQVIEKRLERDFGDGHGIGVVSNWLAFKEDGNNKGIEGSAIHVCNKTQTHYGHLFPPINEAKKNVILFGDNWKDAYMADMTHPDNVLRIGFLNKPTEDLMDKFRKEFDVVIRSDKCDGGFGNELLRRLGIN